MKAHNREYTRHYLNYMVKVQAIALDHTQIEGLTLIQGSFYEQLQDGAQTSGGDSGGLVFQRSRTRIRAIGIISSKHRSILLVTGIEQCIASNQRMNT